MNKPMTTAQKDQNNKLKTVASLMESYKMQFAKALPKHVSVERLLKVALTELRRIPKLAEADPYSFVGAIMSCAQLGLEPGSVKGEVYLIPYGKVVNVIIGYRGMIELARRSGQIKKIEAEAIYSNDDFECEFGLNAKLRLMHARGDRGDLIGAYALAEFKDGGYQYAVMYKEEIEKIRKKSANANSQAWRDHYDEMAKKTVVRRLFKYLPTSIEMQRSFEVEDACENNQFDGKYVLNGSIEDGIIFDEDTGEVLENEEDKNKSQADKLAESIA